MIEDKYIVYSLVINSKKMYLIDSEPSKRWAGYAPWDGGGLPPHGDKIKDEYGWGLVGRCGWAAFYSKRIERSFWNALKSKAIKTIEQEVPDSYEPELVRYPVSEEELIKFLELLPDELIRTAKNRKLPHPLDERLIFVPCR